MQDSREIGSPIPGGGRRCKVRWHVEFRHRLSSAAAFSGRRISILGQAEVRDPKEAESEARFGRRSNRQRKRRQTRQRLRSKTRLPERKLRVTSPAWPKRKRSRRAEISSTNLERGRKSRRKREPEQRPGRRCGNRPRAEIASTASVENAGRRGKTEEAPTV